MDEDAAPLALLTAKPFARPPLWQAQADALACIGPRDKYGLTQQAVQLRAAHAEQYGALIASRRKAAAAAAHNTRPEDGEGDANMGMKPYRRVLCNCPHS